MAKPKTLEKLKASGYRPRSVKEEMRESLLGGLDGEGPLFPGIVGYDETVIPQISNALLSKHNMILLGLRGQAKSRILRSLVNLLDEEIPIIEGCEIPCDPFKPIGAEAHEILRSKGGKTPIRWLPRDQRYVEKLATPDVTIADIIGDIDPIKAAKEGLLLGDELTMHFGLLPRANRGIFAINELPDLAGKIQVGLFNIMQEATSRSGAIRCGCSLMSSWCSQPTPRTIPLEAKSSHPSRTESAPRSGPTIPPRWMMGSRSPRRKRGLSGGTVSGPLTCRVSSRR